MFDDILLLNFLATMPLGSMIASQLFARLSRGLAAIFGPSMLVFAVAVLIILVSARVQSVDTIDGYLVDDLIDSAVMRFMIALLFWIGGVVTLLSILDASWVRWPVPNRLRISGLAFLAATLPAVLLPPVYVHTKCQHAWKRFYELVDSSRIGEARDQLLVVLRLSPNSTWQGRSAGESFQWIQAEYERIEQTCGQLQQRPVDSQTALQQARLLAILGKTELALECLAQSPIADQSIEGNLLRATILETRQQWDAAIECYTNTQKQILDDGTAEDIRDQWTSALRGEAFCRRKAGDYSGSEKAYLRLVQEDPTGENAMLLAYFYEDTQQTDAARRWVREAVRIDPSVTNQARPLWGKLETSHFGCFQAYRDHDKPQWLGSRQHR